jgi:hypothetical protein
MASYVPPKEDPFASIIDGNESIICPYDENLISIYRSWCDLQGSTQQNLLLFEDENFRLRNTVEGESEVKELVSMIYILYGFHNLTAKCSSVNSMISSDFATGSALVLRQIIAIGLFLRWSSIHSEDRTWRVLLRYVVPNIVSR